MKKNQIEKWIDSYYFPEKYEVSDFGNVRNRKTKRVYKFSKNDNGYYQITLCHKGKRINVRVNRLIYLSFFPDTPLHLHIHHLDNDRLNNKLSNLGAIDMKAHSSMHVQMRIISGNFNLKKGETHPSFKGTIIALCPETYEIKHIMVGRYAIESLGFSFSSVYKVIRNEQKSHRNLFFKRISNKKDIKIGEIFSIDN